MAEENTTQTAETTTESLIDTYDNDVKEYLDLPDEGTPTITEQPNGEYNPDEESEDDDKTDTTATETITEEPIKDETPFDLTKIELKGKWNGEEIPISTMLENAIKYVQANPDDLTSKEIIANIQKSYDYSTIKTREKEQLQAIESEKKQIEIIKYENLVNSIGQPPLKSFYNPLNEIDGEVKKNDNGQEYIVYNDEASFLQHQEQEKSFINRYNEYVNSKKESDRQNEVMIENFSKAHPDLDINKFIGEATQYINPSATKGMIPFPVDTLEVFYKGKNFDSLVKSQVDKAVQETTKKLYDEWNKAGKATMPSIKSGKNKIETPVIDDEDDYSRDVQDFLNGKI